MSTEPGGPELISLRELARRLVAEGVLDKISHQRVSQIAREDPKFPTVVSVGKSKAVDWREAEPYFRNRNVRQGQRTDLNRPTGKESSMGDPINPPAREVPELDWYYGPTAWDQDAGKMWHRDCPNGQGEVWVWKDGSYTCSGCNAVQPPGEESSDG